MSTRPERPAERYSAYPKTDASAADSRGSAPPCEFLGPTRVESALNECIGAISLIDVTVHSLDSQQIAAPEQEVLNRAIRALWSVHDWIHDRMWPEQGAESGRDREAQP